LDNFHAGYSLLESLEFSASEVGTYTLSLAAIQTSPRLRTLVADGETLHPFPHDLPMWSQLTRFVGRNMSLAQGWAAILTCSSSLEEYDLTIVGPPTNPIAVQPPTTLPTLRGLHVLRGDGNINGTSCDPSDVRPFLRFLTLPALTELTFSTDDDHISDFLDFMARSSCHLARLIADCDRPQPLSHDSLLPSPAFTG
jgi:hypothetical protein